MIPTVSGNDSIDFLTCICYTRERKNMPQPRIPACRPFGGRGGMHTQPCPHPFPRRSGIKLLLNFLSKKLRVQGSALPLPA